MEYLIEIVNNIDKYSEYKINNGAAAKVVIDIKNR